MAFDGVPADAYERFMGRFSTPLAPLFADLALAGAPTRPTVIDVGCGPGMLTTELARRTGEELITAVDPAASFVSATTARFPRADVRVASAEALPFADGAFDAALAQLVVHFMDDPVAGVREMARVTRPGGPVAACVWDHAEGGSGPLTVFWRTAHRLDPDAGEPGGGWDGARLTAVLVDAGLSSVTSDRLTVTLAFDDFEEWWSPYTDGVGPVGSYVDGLAPDRREALEQALRDELGDGPFALEVGAWAAVGRA
jgi:SAM-dependent methyltransferase